jgi:hypothetical protein
MYWYYWYCNKCGAHGLTRNRDYQCHPGNTRIRSATEEEIEDKNLSQGPPFIW